MGLARMVPAMLLLAATATPGCSVLDRPSPLTKLDAPPALPEPRGTYLDLGRALLRANEPDLAKDAFIRSMRLEGMTAAALTGAGLAAEQQGLLGEARRFFERARVRAPDSVLAHNNLGAVLFRMGEYNAAKQAFQAAFALSSGTNRVASHNLTLSELAILRALEENGLELPNPTPIERRGSGEYVLLGPEAADRTDAPTPVVPEETSVPGPDVRTPEPDPAPKSRPKPAKTSRKTAPEASKSFESKKSGQQPEAKSDTRTGKEAGDKPAAGTEKTAS